MNCRLICCLAMRRMSAGTASTPKRFRLRSSSLSAFSVSTSTGSSSSRMTASASACGSGGGVACCWGSIATPDAPIDLIRSIRPAMFLRNMKIADRPKTRTIASRVQFMDYCPIALGSSFSFSVGINSPRKALARMDCARLSACMLARAQRASIWSARVNSASTR